MTDSLIRAALRTRLKALAGLPVILDENVDPDEDYPTLLPSGAPYLTDAVLPGTRVLGTFPAARGEVNQTGLYQIDLYYPLSEGTGPTDAAADVIEAAFRPGQDIATSDPARPVFVTTFARFPGARAREDSRYRTTLRIGWRWASANALTPA